MTQPSQLLISKTTDKLKEIDFLTDKLCKDEPKTFKYNFKSKCLLDYLLTQISPMQLAEYQQDRKKGLI